MLDLEQINFLDNSAKIRYMALCKLFDHPSYKYIVDWAKAKYEEAQARELTAQTWEQVCYARGNRLAYGDFVNLEDIVDTEFAGLAQAGLEAHFEKGQAEQEEDDSV